MSISSIQIRLRSKECEAMFIPQSSVSFFLVLLLYGDLCGRLSLLTSQKGEWNLGCDLQVIQILNAYKTRGEICLAWV